MRLAVLDVGSNTVHLVVVDGQPDGTFVPVARERETLRMAEVAKPTSASARSASVRARIRVTVAVRRSTASSGRSMAGKAASASRSVSRSRATGTKVPSGWPSTTTRWTVFEPTSRTARRNG